MNEYECTCDCAVNRFNIFLLFLYINFVIEILLMSLPTIHLVAVVAENLFSPNQSQLFQL